jgi:hypothetical protein
MKDQTHNRTPDCASRAFAVRSSAAPTTRAGVPKKTWTLVACLFGMAVLAGCSSTKVTSQESLAAGEKLPRPDHVLVYDFGDTPAEVAPDSTLAGPGTAPVMPPTTEQTALGNQLGYSIAAHLAKALRERGLPAEYVAQGTTPTAQINDIVIRGYLVSVDKGSATKRMTIGFGSGGSELTTAAEVYQMSESGLRKLGSGTTGSKSSKSPGAAAGGAGWLITGTPIGLVTSGGMKIYGETSGSATIEGRAKASAKQIASVLKTGARGHGWIR